MFGDLEGQLGEKMRQYSEKAQMLTEQMRKVEDQVNAKILSVYAEMEKKKIEETCLSLFGSSYIATTSKSTEEISGKDKDYIAVGFEIPSTIFQPPTVCLLD